MLSLFSVPFFILLNTGAVTGLSSMNVEMIPKIARYLHIHYIVVIVDDMENTNTKQKHDLVKGSAPALLIEAAETRNLVNLLKKGSKQWAVFTVLEPSVLRTFLKNITQEYDEVLKNTVWFFWMKNKGLDFPANLIEFDSNVNLLVVEENILEIAEVYNIEIDNEIKLIENTFARYSFGQGFDISISDKWIRRSDLYGLTFKAIYGPEPGYTELNRNLKECSPRNINKIDWSGMIPDIFESLALSLNFTYKLLRSRDRNWGSFDPDSGTWNGAVKDLMEGEADIGIGIYITQSRSTVVDFSSTILSSISVFLVSSLPSYSFDIFIRPFDPLTWIVIHTSILLLAIFLTLILKIGNEREIREFRPKKSLIFVFGTLSALAARRWSITPLNCSGRFVNTFLFIFQQYYFQDLVFYYRYHRLPHTLALESLSNFPPVRSDPLQPILHLR